MYLGISGEGGATLGTMASGMSMSEDHLTKVVQRLAQRGYVHTTRGRRGGVRLVKSPQNITVGAVVRDCEDDLALVPCFDDSAACPITKACALAGTIDEALHAFLGVLDQRTLFDLLANRRELVKLVNAEARRSEA